MSIIDKKVLLREFASLGWRERLVLGVSEFGRVVFSTSFSAEDQLILDFIAEEKLPISVFAIDTGRLPKASYDLWQASLDKYGVEILAFYPKGAELGDFVAKNGINAFYESVELRKKCCEIRKVEPLSRALRGVDLWVSGVRHAHSQGRLGKEVLEWDSRFEVAKLYPLLEATDEELWDLVEQRGVAVNALYRQGYKSIGCDPCSRAVKPGESLRAGRWWWEDASKKECGLH